MVGFGYDSHRLESGGNLIIGGVLVSDKIHPVAHSDGDALAHALIDALFGAAALGDIGEHFPDNSPEFKGADSMALLREAVSLVLNAGFKIINVDATIILEQPKLSPFKELIRNKLSEAVGLPLERISVKAKTNEKLDAIGRGEAIAAYCVCEIQTAK